MTIPTEYREFCAALGIDLPRTLTTNFGHIKRAKK
jgi:hypothetical protein